MELSHRGVVVGPSVGRGAWRGGARAEGGGWRGEPLVFTEAAAGRVLRRSSHDRGCANPRSSHDRGCADPRPAVAAILPLLCAVNDPSRGRQLRLAGQAVPLHRQRGPHTLASSSRAHRRHAERLHDAGTRPRPGRLQGAADLLPFSELPFLRAGFCGCSVLPLAIPNSADESDFGCKS